MKMIKNKKFLLTLIGMLLICLLPLFQNIYQYSKKEISVENLDSEFFTLDNQEISQEFIIEGKLKNLGIYFSTPNTGNYGEAVINISISQNNHTILEQVNVNQVKNNEFYYFSSNMSQLNKGNAVLTISTSNVPSDTSIYCLLSKTEISGLANAVIGETSSKGILVFSYNIFTYNKYFWYDTILITLLLLVIIITSYLLNTSQCKFKPKNYLFYCSFLLIFTTISINNPIASFLAEPHSEMVYEFWYKAHEYGFFKSFMSLMSGESLAWTERILMWIADKISPTQYVFIVAQLLQMLVVCSFTSLFCLDKFKKYITDEARLLICFFIGSSMMFPQGYYFWGVSYWALFFLLVISIMDFNEMRRRNYIACLVISVILCVSRIYHVVFIPIAVIAYFVIGKKRGKRFRIYCGTIAFASIFEVVYSLMRGGTDHISNIGQGINIFKIINNAIYYQVQVMNTLLTGSVHVNGLVSNIIFLVSLVAIIILFIRLLIIYKEKEISCLLGGLGIISLGTVLINVTTCASSSTVSFPINYYNTISWKENYLQISDFHFSYAYISTLAIFICLYYLAKKFILAKANSYIKTINVENVKSIVNYLESILFAIVIGFLIINNHNSRVDIKNVPTQWKAVYEVTKNDSYYISVNVDYGVAPISMQKNSYGLIYGVDKNKNGYIWDNTKPQYESAVVYNKAELGDICDIEQNPLITVTAKRALTNFNVDYVAVFRNRLGEVIDKVKTRTSSNKFWMDFIPDKPLVGVYSIEFELTDGSIAYIKDGLQIGISTEEVPISINEADIVDFSKLSEMTHRELNNEICFSLEYINNVVMVNKNEYSLSGSNELTISGWAADYIKSSPFELIYLKLGDKLYPVTTQIQRDDVSTATKNNDLLHSGFNVTIPSNLLSENSVDTISFILVNSKDETSKKYYYETNSIRIKENGR